MASSKDPYSPPQINSSLISKTKELGIPHYIDK